MVTVVITETFSDRYIQGMLRSSWTQQRDLSHTNQLSPGEREGERERERERMKERERERE